MKSTASLERFESMACILLTTDFSNESKRAFARTVDLARRLQLGITLTHVVVDLRVAPHGAPLAPPQSDPGIANEIEKAKANLRSLATDLGDVDIQTEVLTGETVAQVIIEYARESDVEFIAISTHGRSGLRHLILGSVAEEVVRHASVPVIAFPPK